MRFCVVMGCLIVVLTAGAVPRRAFNDMWLAATPLDSITLYTGSLAIWHSIDTVTGYTNLQPVKSWADSSGNGRTATNTASWPVYTNGFVSFDGSAQTLNYGSDTNSLAVTKNCTGITVMVTARWKTVPTGNKVIWGAWVGGVNNTRIGMFGGNTSTKLSILGRRNDGDASANVASSSAITTNWAVYTCVGDYAVASARVYINDTLEGSNSWLTAGSTPDTEPNGGGQNIGAIAGNFMADVEIKDVAVWREALTNDRVTNNVAYFRSLRGI